MSWRQNSASKIGQNQVFNEIKNLKIENTKMKIMLEESKRQMSLKDQQAKQLSASLNEYKGKQDKIKNQIIKIGAIINTSQLYHAKDTLQMLDIIQRRVLQNKQKLSNLEKEFKNLSENYNLQRTQNQNREKQFKTAVEKVQKYQDENKKLLTRINSLTQNLQLYKSENQKKQAILTEYSNKLRKFEMQKNGIQAQINEIRSSSNNFQAQTIKKQCQQLLDKINVRSDDYLKSYIMKSYKFQNLNNSIHRKNKYDFIFLE